ncbi:MULTISPECIES: STM4015 family protein [Actinomadura]|uniref:STM4015 family protein n=1 Tax=Actinomadura yumaensis TaxID=111807 RepID=A0ABW2CQL5_9ACTN|nr:STM4015 family protein [Actinomadura sp. J1-007]MWK37560.1 leucine-rich repeat domain-containing protein [Actinomadura sp. J1-007]
MTIHEHVAEFAGLPVEDFQDLAGDPPPESGERVPEAGAVAWGVRTGFDEAPFPEVFGRFVENVETEKVTALVIGYWGASYDQGAADPVALLADAADRFPALRALFIGDIVMEESEVSWIEHSDITPVFEAYPRLERFDVRGSQEMRLKPIRSEHLKVLRFESGGLPAGVVRAVAASDLPALERLDLWLGTENYGGDATVRDLAPLLSGERFPALRHLGLENSEIQDEIAAAVAGAPVVARLETLSLAMGALTDEGAEALLTGQPLTHLRRLDLHHHFLTDPMVERVSAALPGVEVDLNEQEEPDDDWRYIAVSE